MTIHIRMLLGVALFLFCFGLSHASSSGHPLADIEFSQDEPSLKRGAMIYYKTCRACHDMKYIHYKNLFDIGFTKYQVDKIRGERRIDESFLKTVNSEVLTEYYGQVPPDLSVMAKARKNGPQYIYTLMTSYTYSEKDNVYDNALFEGIKMPDVLNISTAVEETQKADIRRDIKDVAEFLLWASDPHAEERKTTGIYVVIYFIILSSLLFLIMKRVWSRLDDYTEKSG